ncbi:hypothetical protein EDD15DRAFT_2280527, partial [Pisolithus albus]
PWFEQGPSCSIQASPSKQGGACFLILSIPGVLALEAAFLVGFRVLKVTIDSRVVLHPPVWGALTCSISISPSEHCTFPPCTS